jgi:hypothetical protein
MNLEENGIYALPDGLELIARIGNSGAYLLHDPKRGVAAAPLYLVDQSGHLLSWGRTTRWTMNDLQHTGRVSLPQMQRMRLV